MTYSSKTVKDIIETFVKENIDESITVEGKGGESFLANKAIFEIESFLVQLRSQYNINSRLDTSIVSKNILEKFSNVSSLDAFKPIDYQYNFLYHLAAEYSSNLDLYSLIDSFINKFKSQFRLADIVITNTGATRCKTNIRFALNELRDMSLILSRNSNNKRSWSPSVIGLVALLNIQLNFPESKSWPHYKESDSLISARGGQRNIPGFFSQDPVLIQSILMFKDPAYLYVYLSGHRDISLNEEEKNLLRNIINDYIEFTEAGLEITQHGIKMTKAFVELSKAFQQKLFSVEKSNAALHRKLFEHFRNKK